MNVAYTVYCFEYALSLIIVVELKLKALKIIQQSLKYDKSIHKFETFGRKPFIRKFLLLKNFNDIVI
jgi:hypothetical protein